MIEGDDMDTNKQILKFCPNFYKILNFTPYKDDKISEKLIRLYQKYIFKIDTCEDAGLKRLENSSSSYT